MDILVLHIWAWVTVLRCELKKKETGLQDKNTIQIFNKLWENHLALNQ